MAKKPRKNTEDQPTNPSLYRRHRYFYGMTFEGDRDLYTVLGYPQVLRPSDFVKMYFRNDIASRIVKAFPQATWRDAPILDDDKEAEGVNTESRFVKDWNNLVEKKNILHYLERADRLNGLGQFSILVMGFQDGKDLSEPLEEGKAPLLYLAPYGEENITITQWDQSPHSRRFGLPEMYVAQRGNSAAFKRSATRTIRVHHSRVLHISEFLDDDETYGVPRLEPIYNRLLDLEKISGGASEAFWLMANRGLALLTRDDAELTEDDKTAMENQASEYQHQLRRILTMQGVDVQVLGSEVPQPEETADLLLKIIAGSTGIPLRILTGSEQGELASSQDEGNWSARIDERRENFAAPRILRPFIEKMIMTGNLASPEKEWAAYWEPGSTLSEGEKADVAMKKAQATAFYLQTPGADQVIKLEEMREMLGLDKDAELTLDELPPLEEDEPEEEPPLAAE